MHIVKRLLMFLSEHAARTSFSDIYQSFALSRALRSVPDLLIDRREAGIFHLVVFVKSWRKRSGMRKIIPGFSPSVYAQEHALNSKDDPTLHFLRNQSPNGPWIRRVVSKGSALGKERLLPSVALHLHVHYPELLGFILDALKTNKALPALFITTFEEGSLKRIRQDLLGYAGRSTVIQLRQNVGRDLGPFFTHLPAYFFSDFDLVGHLHTKKSESHTDMKGARGWFEYCVGNMLGTSECPGMLDRVLEEFATNSNIGMVYPDDPHVMGWTKNFDSAVGLLERGTLPAKDQMFDFPIGSYFYARPLALRPLLQLQLKDDDYPPEPVPYDGTNLHALERLLGLVPRQMGYDTAVTFVSSLYR
jgi:hypothetical protein